MNKARKNLKTGTTLILSAFLLWAIETAIFLIVYGWHIEPYNETEKFLDGFCSGLLWLGIAYWVSVVLDVVHYVIYLYEETQVTLTIDIKQDLDTGIYVGAYKNGDTTLFAQGNSIEEVKEKIEKMYKSTVK